MDLRGTFVRPPLRASVAVNKSDGKRQVFLSFSLPVCNDAVRGPVRSGRISRVAAVLSLLYCRCLVSFPLQSTSNRQPGRTQCLPVVVHKHIRPNVASQRVFAKEFTLDGQHFCRRYFRRLPGPAVLQSSSSQRTVTSQTTGSFRSTNLRSDGLLITRSAKSVG